jgi:hypothetical protein
MKKILARYAFVAIACVLLLAPSAFASGSSAGADAAPGQTITSQDGSAGQDDNGTEEGGPTMPHY